MKLFGLLIIGLILFGVFYYFFQGEINYFIPKDSYNFKPINISNKPDYFMGKLNINGKEMLAVVSPIIVSTNIAKRLNYSSYDGLIVIQKNKDIKPIYKINKNGSIQIFLTTKDIIKHDLWLFNVIPSNLELSDDNLSVNIEYFGKGDELIYDLINMAFISIEDAPWIDKVIFNVKGINTTFIFYKDKLLSSIQNRNYVDGMIRIIKSEENYSDLKIEGCLPKKENYKKMVKYYYMIIKMRKNNTDAETLKKYYNEYQKIWKCNEKYKNLTRKNDVNNDNFT